MVSEGIMGAIKKMQGGKAAGMVVIVGGREMGLDGALGYVI